MITYRTAPFTEEEIQKEKKQLLLDVKEILNIMQMKLKKHSEM